LWLRPGRNHDPATRAYLRMCSALAGAGLERHAGEGPLDYCRRISQTRPDLAAEVRAITDDFLALGYAGGTSAIVRGRLRRASRRFSLRVNVPSHVFSRSSNA